MKLSGGLLRVEMVPFTSVKEADEQLIEKMCYVSVKLPRLDDKSNADRIIFGDPNSIIVGRERNIYWGIQKATVCDLNLKTFQKDIIRSIVGNI